MATIPPGNGSQSARFAEGRRLMVESQIRKRGVTDERVLHAMATVPRHEFVPASWLNQAYADEPLPIGFGQTISQPYIVAAMAASLGLTGSEIVLEIGTGCGYQAAIVSLLAREVHTVEHLPDLARSPATPGLCQRAGSHRRWHAWLANLGSLRCDSHCRRRSIAAGTSLAATRRRGSADSARRRRRQTGIAATHQARRQIPCEVLRPVPIRALDGAAWLEEIAFHFVI